MASRHFIAVFVVIFFAVNFNSDPTILNRGHHIEPERGAESRHGHLRFKWSAARVHGVCETMDQFENSYFDSSDELFEYFREHADDIESVIIPVQDGMMLIGPPGQQNYTKGCGAMVKLVDGTSRLIHRGGAETLINDGLLQRLRVKGGTATLIRYVLATTVVLKPVKHAAILPVLSLPRHGPARPRSGLRTLQL